MNTWDDEIARLNVEPSTSASWRSDRKSLLAIIKVAQQWEIVPDYFAMASVSVLRRILFPAREAIKSGQKERLEEVFRKAGTLTLADFLLEYGLVEREKIMTKEEKRDDEIVYIVELNESQLRRIERETKTIYEFVFL